MAAFVFGLYDSSVLQLVRGNVSVQDDVAGQCTRHRDPMRYEGRRVHLSPEVRRLAERPVRGAAMPG